MSATGHLRRQKRGQGCHDRIFRDGQVHDPDRIDFLASYLEELAAACRDSARWYARFIAAQGPDMV